MKRTVEPLANHTWLKIGGPSEIAIPESEEELVGILTECTTEEQVYRILGNGSNVLVSDEGIDELVIKITEACTELTIDNEYVSVGSSVRLPAFVNELVEHGFGGYEYLYSVPATIGGALYMNAGRGKKYGKTIADYLVEVEVFDGDEKKSIEVDELTFSHRYSTFQEHPKWTILSATFRPPSQPKDVGKKKIKERMEEVKQRERSVPTAGSVFSLGARLPLHLVPPEGLQIGGARFVETNRICNVGDATYDDIIRLIRIAKLLNTLVPPFRKPTLELEIWN